MTVKQEELFVLHQRLILETLTQNISLCLGDNDEDIKGKFAVSSRRLLLVAMILHVAMTDNAISLEWQ